MRNWRKRKKEKREEKEKEIKKAVISNIEKWWFGQVAVIQKREITLVPRRSWT